MEILHKECYVAFLDILGFKEICLERASKEILKIFHDIKQIGNELKECHITISRSKEAIQNLHDNLYFYIMSDSIVLAIDCKLEGSYDFLLVCCKTIQRKLLFDHKILLRGGVSKGCFYGDQDIMFGEGLINAYNIEKKAEVPRVCVDKKITDDPPKNYLKVSVLNKAFNLLEEDKENDIFFVNYIEDDDYTNDGKMDKFSEIVDSGYDKIKKQSKETEKLTVKYNWLKDYHKKVKYEHNERVNWENQEMEE